MCTLTASVNYNMVTFTSCINGWTMKFKWGQTSNDEQWSGGFFLFIFKCIWTTVICSNCLAHIFHNYNFFFSFMHACFLFPFKGWMEYHVVFGKMLYGMDVVYKSEVEGYFPLLFWDVIGQIYINFTIYLEMVSLRKDFKNLIHSLSISKLFS